MKVLLRCSFCDVQVVTSRLLKLDELVRFSWTASRGHTLTLSPVQESELASRWANPWRGTPRLNAWTSTSCTTRENENYVLLFERLANSILKGIVFLYFLRGCYSFLSCKGLHRVFHSFNTLVSGFRDVRSFVSLCMFSLCGVYDDPGKVCL